MPPPPPTLSSLSPLQRRQQVIDVLLGAYCEPNAQVDEAAIRTRVHAMPDDTVAELLQCLRDLQAAMAAHLQQRDVYLRSMQAVANVRLLQGFIDYTPELRLLVLSERLVVAVGLYGGARGGSQHCVTGQTVLRLVALDQDERDRTGKARMRGCGWVGEPALLFPTHVHPYLLPRSLGDRAPWSP